MGLFDAEIIKYIFRIELVYWYQKHKIYTIPLSPLSTSIRTVIVLRFIIVYPDVLSVLKDV